MDMQGHRIGLTKEKLKAKLLDSKKWHEERQSKFPLISYEAFCKLCGNYLSFCLNETGEIYIDYMSTEDAVGNIVEIPPGTPCTMSDTQKICARIPVPSGKLVVITPPRDVRESVDFDINNLKGKVDTVAGFATLGYLAGCVGNVGVGLVPVENGFDLVQRQETLPVNTVLVPNTFMWVFFADASPPLKGTCICSLNVPSGIYELSYNINDVVPPEIFYMKEGTLRWVAPCL
jgi:hypothetical protein